MPTEEEVPAAKDIMAQPASDAVDFAADRVDARRKATRAGLGPFLDLDVSVLTFGEVYCRAGDRRARRRYGRRIAHHPSPDPS